MGGLASLVTDMVLMGLLVAVIFHAVRLNRRLGILRESKAELEKLVQNLMEMTAKAESGLRDLRAIAVETSVGLQERIDKAVTLRDEMHFIVESGNQVADRLMQGMATARSIQPASSESKATPDFAIKPRKPSIPGDETPRAAPPGIARIARVPNSEVPAGDLLLPAEPPRRADMPPKGKSKAEKELIQAINQLSTDGPAVGPGK